VAILFSQLFELSCQDATVELIGQAFEGPSTPWHALIPGLFSMPRDPFKLSSRNTWPLWDYVSKMTHFREAIAINGTKGS
jgi:hypothetical protein